MPSAKFIEIHSTLFNEFYSNPKHCQSHLPQSSPTRRKSTATINEDSDEKKRSKKSRAGPTTIQSANVSENESEVEEMQNDQATRTAIRFSSLGSLQVGPSSNNNN